MTIPAESAQQLAIAVNELAMNAAKHSYPWGERGPLHIASLEASAKQKIPLVSYLVQNGIAPSTQAITNGPPSGGWPRNACSSEVRSREAGIASPSRMNARMAVGAGLGMSILQAIVRQLRGTLDAADDGGARFTITVPMPARRTLPSRSFAPESKRRE